MNLFYAANIHPGSPLVLSEEESGHCIRVLRMKAGSTLYFTDGKGFFYKAVIVSDHPKKCTVNIIQTIPDHAKRNFHITVAMAPPKSNERFEWFLEKATEIGCDEIAPLKCIHSERTRINPERLNKVIVSALKQCLKSQLPVLSKLQDYETFILSVKQFNGQKYIAHIPELSTAEFPPPNPNGVLLQSVYKKGNNCIIAVGPEGGFSKAEIETAIENGFIPVSLGRSRLRVETAGIVACSIANALNQ
jgi:16S rRNA (uracil1498-N3)-methyltransferase